MFNFVSLMSGLIFGFGLIISGMINPAKVLGFLDLYGQWDPSLALVMIGAISVGFVAFHFAQPRKLSMLDCSMQIPTNKRVDCRCILGCLTFGIGWGLAGFCPGPALVALSTGQYKVIIFVLFMIAGMSVFEWIERLRNITNR